MDSRPSTALPQAQLCLQLAKKVRGMSQEKGFYESSVQVARRRLRDALEAFLLQDYATAQEKDLEHVLWKTVYYKVIEEFRARIAAADGKGEQGLSQLSKAKTAFSQVLADGLAFYTRLISKLQNTYGNVGLVLEAKGKDVSIKGIGEPYSSSANGAPSKGGEGADHRVSIFRCLICLGDLARYQASLDTNRPKKDWSRAEQYYMLAIEVYPEGGNPYNQLAVLRMHTGAALAAVHYYFCALAVQQPFEVARQNVRTLFTQNEVAFKTLRRAPASSQPIGALLASLGTRFVHLHGLLFTGVNLDSFDGVCFDTLRDLDELLDRPAIAQAAVDSGEAPAGQQQPGRGLRSESLLLQLATTAIFASTAACGGIQSSAGGYSEALQRAEVQRHAQALVVGLVARLAAAAARCGRLGERAAAARAVLAPLHVLLQWLATQPNFTRAAAGAEGDGPGMMWVALTSLAGALPPAPQTPAGAGGSPAPRAALPEDRELRGFLPLAEAHARLDRQAGLQAPAAGPADAQLRLQRLAESLRLLADMVAKHTHASPAASLFANALQACAQAKEPQAVAEHSPAPACAALGAEEVAQGTDANVDEEEMILYAAPAPAPASSDPRSSKPATLPAPALPLSACAAGLPWGQVEAAGGHGDAAGAELLNGFSPQHPASAAEITDGLGAPTSFAADTCPLQQQPPAAPAAEAPAHPPTLQPEGGIAAQQLVTPDPRPGLLPGWAEETTATTSALPGLLPPLEAAGPSRLDPVLPELPRWPPGQAAGTKGRLALGLGVGAQASLQRPAPVTPTMEQPATSRPAPPPGFDAPSQRASLGGGGSRPLSPALVAPGSSLRPPPGFLRPQSQAGSRPASPYLGQAPSARSETFAGGVYLPPSASNLPLASQLIPATSQLAPGSASASSMFGPGLLATSRAGMPSAGPGLDPGLGAGGALYGLGGPTPWSEGRWSGSHSVLADPAVKHASLKSSSAWDTGRPSEVGAFAQTPVQAQPQSAHAQLASLGGGGDASFGRGSLPMGAAGPWPAAGSLGQAQALWGMGPGASRAATPGAPIAEGGLGSSAGPWGGGLGGVSAASQPLPVLSSLRQPTSVPTSPWGDALTSHFYGAQPTWPYHSQAWQDSQAALPQYNSELGQSLLPQAHNLAGVGALGGGAGQGGLHGFDNPVGASLGMGSLAGNAHGLGLGLGGPAALQGSYLAAIEQRQEQLALQALLSQQLGQPPPAPPAPGASAFQRASQAPAPVPQLSSGRQEGIGRPSFATGASTPGSGLGSFGFGQAAVPGGELGAGKGAMGLGDGWWGPGNVLAAPGGDTGLGVGSLAFMGSNALGMGAAGSKRAFQTDNPFVL